MPSYAQNRKAFHEYTISDTLEAGLVLDGHEVKSIRNSQVSLNGAYVSVRGGEAYLKNAFIARYKNAAHLETHNENRDRKLLLHKNEIGKLATELDKKGTVIVPLEIYTSKRRVKLKIGIGKGKKQFDKRATIKEKETKRMVSRATRQKGFTLLELLVVISMAALLSSVMMVSFSQARLKAIDTRTITDIDAIGKAAELYFYDNNRYPAPNLSLSYVTTLPVPPGWHSEWTQLNPLLSPYLSHVPRPHWNDARYEYFQSPIRIHGLTECIIVYQGWYMRASMNDAVKAANDGGVYPDHYEKWGGRAQKFVLPCPP